MQLRHKISVIDYRASVVECILHVGKLSREQLSADVSRQSFISGDICIAFTTKTRFSFFKSFVTELL